MKRIFGELHCYLTYIYIIFLSLFTYISAYFIDFVIFNFNVIFKGIIHPKVLLKTEIENSGIREYNSLSESEKIVQSHKS